MKIKTLFFGRLTDVVNNLDNLELNEKSNIEDLKKIIDEKFPEIKKYTYRIAVNKELIRGNLQLKENDEVAFMPPFAGG